MSHLEQSKIRETTSVNVNQHPGCICPDCQPRRNTLLCRSVHIQLVCEFAETPQVLHKHGFPVPTPIDQARHTVLMSLEDALPLRSIAEVEDPAKLCSQLFDLIVKLAEAGLVHGDFNEFNILIRSEDEQPVLIDFPQMVSVSHPNAEE